MQDKDKTKRLLENSHPAKQKKIKDPLSSRVDKRKSISKADKEAEAGHGTSPMTINAYVNKMSLVASVVENAKDIIYRMSLPDGRYEYVSPSSTELTGYTPDEHYLNPFLVREVIHPDFRNYLREQWEEIIKGNCPASYEYKILHKSGAERWVHQTNVLIRNNKGQPVAIEGIVRDVTEQKLLEEKLRQSQEIYRIVADNTYGWEFWLDPGGRFIYSSPSCKRITGYEAAEFLSDPSLIEKIVYDEDKELLLAHRAEVTGNRCPQEVEFRITHRDGSVKWIGHACQPVFAEDGEFLGTRGSNHDITTRKTYEASIQTHETRYQELTKRMVRGVTIYELSEDGRDFVFRDINLAGEKILQVTREEVLGKNLTELFPGVKRDGLLEVFLRVCKTGEPEQKPVWRYQDGRLSRWLENQVYKLPTGEIVSVFEDLTESKQLQENLRDNEEKYRRLFEDSRDAIFIIKQNRIIDANAAAWKLFGYRGKDEFLPRHPAELSPAFQENGSDSFVIANQRLELAMKGESQLFEWQHKRANGEVFHTEVQLSKIDLGNDILVQAIVRDITKRRQAEQQLMVSQQNFEALFNAITESVFLIDKKGKVLAANDAMASRLGIPRPDLIGGNIYKKTINPELAAIRKGMAEKVIKTGKPIEFEDLDKTKGRWLYSHVYPCFDPKGSVDRLVVYAIDITERKRIEAKLEEQSELRNRLFESSVQPIVVMDPDTCRFIDCNAATVAIYDFGGIEKTLGKTLFDVSAPIQYDGTLSQDKARHYVAQGLNEGFVIFDWRHQRPDGTQWDAEVHLMRFASGETNLLQFTLLDITERKKEKQALRESEDRFRTLAESAPIAIILIAPDEKFQYINEGYTKLFGYTLEDTPDCRTAFEKFYPDPEYRNKIIASWNVARKLNAWDKQSVRKTDVSCKDGSLKKVHAISNVLANSSFLLMFVDVTELDHAQKMLEQSRKLESIGTLAGGIAHDFNNLMAAMLGYIQLAKMDDQIKEATVKQLLAAEWALHQATELTHRLITFAKGGDPLKKPCDVKEILKDEFYKNKASAHLVKQSVIDPDLWSAHIDEIQIRQVIKNLINNAIDAMADGGILSVGADNVMVNAEDRLPLSEGAYIRFYVKDTGTGIKRGDKARIFDPYFTTKSRGAKKGMGLGLSVAFSIVKKHDGYITANSSEGKGTVFFVYLPATDVATGAGLVQAASLKSKGRILVMDDDPLFAEAMEDIINALGYDVVTASDGFKAIDLYIEAKGKPGGQFDLVILDLNVTAGLGGKLAMKKLTAIDPDVKAIICSGYSDDPVMQNYRDYGFTGTLLKPFNLDQLKSYLDKV